MRLLKTMWIWFRGITGESVLTPERLRSAGLL